MNIAFLTELFPPSTGGQEQRFAELANLLATRGHRVTVMCIRHSPGLAAHETLSNGVTVIRLPTAGQYYKPFGGAIPRSPLGMIQYALAVRRLSHREFDAVFLNQWPLLHIAMLPRHYRACAIIDWCEIRNSAVFLILQQIFPRLVAANTAVSMQVAQRIRRSSSGPVLILPSGISVTEYRASSADCRSGFLYVGRITRHKDLPLLISTFEELCSRGHDETLKIAGDGPAFDAVRRRVQSSPVAEKIELLGLVSDERKCQLLADSRLLMLTSRREGFPRIVAEGIASGLPVVTARYPQNGTVSIVEEYRCGLCADPTPRDLANAAQVVLADWAKWSARASLQASRLDWSSIVGQFEALLGEITAAAKNSEPRLETKGAPCESL